MLTQDTAFAHKCPVLSTVPGYHASSINTEWLPGWFQISSSYHIYLYYPHIILPGDYTITWGFPGGASGKESAHQCRRLKRFGFDSWVWTEVTEHAHRHEVFYIKDVCSEKGMDIAVVSYFLLSLQRAWEYLFTASSGQGWCPPIARRVGLKFAQLSQYALLNLSSFRLWVGGTRWELNFS